MAYDTPVAGLPQRHRQHAAPVGARSRRREFDLVALQRRRLRARGRGQDAVARTSPRSSIPPTTSYAGKELRLKQQYFFVSATLQDVLRRFRKRPRLPWSELPGEGGDPAQRHAPGHRHPRADARPRRRGAARLGRRPGRSPQRVFAYTNHTVLPEALESLADASCSGACCRGTCRSSRRSTAASAGRCARAGADERAALQRTGHRRRRRGQRAHGQPGDRRQPLASTAWPSCTREILHERTVPPTSTSSSRAASTTRPTASRRGAGSLQCNPRPRRAHHRGDRRRLDDRPRRAARARALRRRRVLPRALAASEAREQGRARRLAAAAAIGIDLDPESLFDCQVKRIHEYKRQLLNVLHVLVALPRGSQAGEERRAAHRALRRQGRAGLLHGQADHPADPRRGRRRRRATRRRAAGSASSSCRTTASRWRERIFPACELSEQISTAGTEASGTGNMKAALNGALTIGTLDGANIEIRDAGGRARTSSSSARPPTRCAPPTKAAIARQAGSRATRS